MLKGVEYMHTQVRISVTLLHFSISFLLDQAHKVRFYMFQLYGSVLSVKPSDINWGAKKNR